MNWREQRHLFANGKFKAQINWVDGSKSVSEIKGYFCAYPFEHDFLDGKEYLPAFDFGSKAMPTENCTLIARKIEDMSDEEIKTLLSNVTKSETKNYKFAGTLYKGDYRIFYEERRRKNGDRFDGMVFKVESANRDSFLYLLSIGVYPFDQSHFDTGEVVDIKTLTEQ